MSLLLAALRLAWASSRWGTQIPISYRLRNMQDRIRILKDRLNAEYLEEFNESNWNQGKRYQDPFALRGAFFSRTFIPALFQMA